MDKATETKNTHDELNKLLGDGWRVRRVTDCYRVLQLPP